MKKRPKSVTECKIDLLIAEYRQNRSADSAIGLMELVMAGAAKVTARFDDRLMFMASKYNGKCCRCKDGYKVGTPVFVRNKQGWHLECASDEEKQCPDYVHYMKRLQASEPAPTETEGEFPAVNETETNNPPLRQMN